MFSHKVILPKECSYAIVTITFLSLCSEFSCVYAFRYCTIWGDYGILLRADCLKSAWMVSSFKTSSSWSCDILWYFVIYLPACVVFWILLFGISLMVSLLLIVLNAISGLYVTQDTFDILKGQQIMLFAPLFS